MDGFNRFVLVCSIAALVAVGVGIGFAELGPESGGWQRAGGSFNGWSLEYPSDWNVHMFPDCEFLGYRGAVVMSSIEFKFRTPVRPHGGTNDPCYSRFVMAGFPKGAVGVALQPEGFRSFGAPGRDTRFPLSLSRLFATGGIRGGPRAFYRVIWLDGQELYFVRVWIGRKASTEDRAALARVVTSIRFEDRIA